MAVGLESTYLLNLRGDWYHPRWGLERRTIVLDETLFLRELVGR